MAILLLMLFICGAYGQGIICNYNHDYACVCRNEAYPTCDAFISPNKPLNTVVVEIGNPPSGDFEKVFKQKVADVVGTYCLNKTDECHDSVVSQEHVVFLTLSGNTIEFVIVQSGGLYYHLHNDYLLDSAMIVRLLVQAQLHGVRSMRVVTRSAHFTYPSSNVGKQEEIEESNEKHIVKEDIEESNEENVVKEQIEGSHEEHPKVTDKKVINSDGIWPYVAGGCGVASLLGSGFAIYKYRK